MTILQTLNRATDQLKKAGIVSAKLDAELLLAQVLQVKRERLLTHPEHELPLELQGSFQSLIARRKNRVPLVHLTGTREFYGLELEITPNVLTPRVETEQIVDWATGYSPRTSRFIDIGTGSGAIALAVAKMRPDIEVWGTDLDIKALEVAKRNAKRYNLELNFMQSDLFNNVVGRFSTIATNLPYLRTDADLMPEVTKEPPVALFGGADGLELYRRFFNQVLQHLEPRAFVFCECDPWQQIDLIELAARINLVPIERGYFITGFQLK